MSVRLATEADIPRICTIYNQGIEDRTATLETRLRTVEDMLEWLRGREARHCVLVSVDPFGMVTGWASVNPFSGRCCYSGVGDISVYIARESRGMGIGTELLQSLCNEAVLRDFHKLVLGALSYNEAGLKLYTRCGFRQVGVYEEQGLLDGRPVDVVIMEKKLSGLISEK